MADRKADLVARARPLVVGLIKLESRLASRNQTNAATTARWAAKLDGTGVALMISSRRIGWWLLTFTSGRQFLHHNHAASGAPGLAARPGARLAGRE